MSFYLQDPGNPATKYLVELLLDECKTSNGGGASFAWATRRGINLLLEHPDFLGFLEANPFDLVVGLDAVTDPAALGRLADLDKHLKHLTVSVFLNPYTDVLFHPKVCWFERSSGGTLVTGSGNLTEAGLSRNWEAFTANSLNKKEMQAVKDSWNTWKVSYKDHLLLPTDAAAIAWTKKTEALKLPRPKPEASAKKKRLGRVMRGHRVPFTLPPAQASAAVPDVLVAEIPKASTRWHQANFDLDNYTNFFGAKIGEQRYMFFRHVRPDGSVGETEVRPSVAVKSSNWRFELAAGHGQDYPTTGRPIGVFLKQASRNFLYVLLMPGEVGYGKINTLLSKEWKGSASNVRRVRVMSSALAKAWISSPLLTANADEPPES